MPVLKYTIELDVDQASKSRIAEQINALSSGSGSTSSINEATSAVKKRDNAEKELLKDLRTKITLEENAFRFQGQAQEQTLKNIQGIREQTKYQDLLNKQTYEGAQATKSFGLAQQRVQSNFTGLAPEVRHANIAFVDLNRIIQDLPFGFLGISNNIPEAQRSLGELSRDTNGVKGAMGALLTQLMSPAGIGFALASIIPTVILMSQKFNFFSKSVDKAKDNVKAFGDEIQKIIDKGARLEGAGPFNLHVKASEKALAQSVLDLLKKRADITSRIRNTQRLIVSGGGAYTQSLQDQLVSLQNQKAVLTSTLSLYGKQNSTVKDTQDRIDKINVYFNSLKAAAKLPGMAGEQARLALVSETVKSNTEQMLNQIKALGTEGFDISKKMADNLINLYRNKMDPILKKVRDDISSGKYSPIDDKKIAQINIYKEAIDRLNGSLKKTDKVAKDAASSLKVIHPPTVPVNVPKDQIPPWDNPSLGVLSGSDLRPNLGNLPQKGAVGSVLALQAQIQEKHTQFLNATTDADRLQIGKEEQILQKRLDNYEKFEKSKSEIANKESKQRAALASTVALLAGNAIGLMFGKQKGAAVANAIMNTREAITNALKAAPPPINFALAAAVGAFGFNEVRQILDTKLGSKSTGDTNTGGEHAQGSPSPALATLTNATQQANYGYNPYNVQAGMVPQNGNIVLNVTNNAKFDEMGLAIHTRVGEEKIGKYQIQLKSN